MKSSAFSSGYALSIELRNFKICTISMIISLSNNDSSFDIFTLIHLSRSHFAMSSSVLFFFVIIAISFGFSHVSIFSCILLIIQDISSSSLLNRCFLTLPQSYLTASNFFTAHSNIFHISFNSDLITVRELRIISSFDL